MPEVIDVTEKFGRFTDHWHPRIVGEFNDSYVKLVKLKGEFVWHKHEMEDELFWVIRGSLLIRFRDRDVTIEEGQLVIIPRGVEHLPIAAEEVHVVLLEPKTTVNTGELRNERTRDAEWI